MPVRIRMEGFSLVETLVALAIVSAGMLGIAGLYVDSLSDNRSAILRAQAVNLAIDMAERIRANRNAGIAGDAYAIGADGLPIVQGCAAAGLGCRQIALAQDDVSRWLVAIRDSLPGDGNRTPNGTISVDTTTTPTTYTITVSWSEPGTNRDSSCAIALQV